MDNYISNKLLVNLKIISKIEKNGRITRSKNGVINLDYDTITQPVRRYFNGDSRNQTIYELDSIANECITTLTSLLNSKYLTEIHRGTTNRRRLYSSINLLITKIKESFTGLENLKFTYIDDLNVSSQIDIIILKLRETVEDTVEKLSRYDDFELKEILLDGETQQDKDRKQQEKYDINLKFM
jgi:hypothetical protein